MDNERGKEECNYQCSEKAGIIGRYVSNDSIGCIHYISSEPFLLLKPKYTRPFDHINKFLYNNEFIGQVKQKLRDWVSENGVG
jgi:hypothetical protein